MPNRIIKESICTSKDIDQLKPEEEIFFYRIIVNCDDYGRMEADPVILRAKCFPRRTDKIKEKTIIKWLQALSEATLIALYRVDDKIFVQLVSWAEHQQIRANKSKFPSMDDNEAEIITLDGNGNQLISDDSKCSRNRTRNRERNRNTEQPTVDNFNDLFENLWTTYPNKKGRPESEKCVAKILETVTIDELTRAVKRYAAEVDGKEKQYIKHGSTFFNKGYVDYLDKNFQEAISKKEPAESNYVWVEDEETNTIKKVLKSEMSS